MADLMQKLGNMMNSQDMPEELKQMMDSFSSSNTAPPPEEKTYSTQDNMSFPDIDLNMMLKLKSIMDSMKNQKEDPRANLLRSLKPYLKSSRRDKVDQYIQMFQMTKVMEIFQELGGDKQDGKP